MNDRVTNKRFGMSERISHFFPPKADQIAILKNQRNVTFQELFFAF